jgi:hypothetical protein
MLFTPLLQPLYAFQHQVIPLHNLLDDLVFQFVRIIVDVHQVQLKPILRVEQHQSFYFGVFDEVQHRVVTFAHVFYLVVNVFEWGGCDEVDV